MEAGNQKQEHQGELIRAIAAVSPPPDPPSWVQQAQIGLAAACLAIAAIVAFSLLWFGPPAPKTPDGSSGEAPAETTTTTAAPMTANATTRTVADATTPEEETEVEGAPEQPEEPAPAEEDEEGSESLEGESLASLNEQAPWAFAIVALLVAAFLATGKALSFGGAKEE